MTPTWRGCCASTGSPRPGSADVAGLADAVAQVVAELKAAGVNASQEASDLDLPGVVVYPDLVSYERLDATTYRLDVGLLFVAGQLRAPDALDLLDGLIDAVAAVLPLNELRAVMVRLGSQSADDLPAFQTTVSLAVTTEGNEE